MKVSLDNPVKLGGTNGDPSFAGILTLKVVGFSGDRLLQDLGPALACPEEAPF